MPDRDEKGRFLPGNKASPGRPPRQTEGDYLTVITSRISMETWGKVVDRALKDALAGDHRARAWLADYLIGKPLLRTLPEGEDDRRDLVMVFQMLPEDATYETLNGNTDEQPQLPEPLEDDESYLGEGEASE